jgi:hypothetical protein
VTEHHGCTINGQPAMPILISDYNRLVAHAARAEAALARIQALADEHPAGIDTALIHEALDQTSPAATQATEAETTTRVFAALHHSAEQDVSRVIALYEQWVKAGPPPLGVLINRWWDMRLAELHRALTSPAEQPARTTPNNSPTSSDSTDNPGPTVREAAADDRAHWNTKYAGEES